MRRMRRLWRGGGEGWGGGLRGGGGGGVGLGGGGRGGGGGGVRGGGGWGGAVGGGWGGVRGCVPAMVAAVPLVLRARAKAALDVVRAAVLIRAALRAAQLARDA